MKSEYRIKVIRPLYTGKALYFPPKSVSLIQASGSEAPNYSYHFQRFYITFPDFTFATFCISAVARKISNLYAWILHLSISLFYPICSNFAATVPSRRFLSFYYLIMGFEFLFVHLSIFFSSLTLLTPRKIMLRIRFNFTSVRSETKLNLFRGNNRIILNFQQNKS